jgi:transporter family-2 protein
MYILAIILALIAGFSVAIQATFNNQLSHNVGTIWTILTSHLVGAIFAFLIIILTPNSFNYMGESIVGKFKEAPLYSFFGGVMGVIMVGSVLYAFKRISVAQVLAMVTLGH